MYSTPVQVFYRIGLQAFFGSNFKADRLFLRVCLQAKRNEACKGHSGTVNVKPFGS